jgi:hypothetical protein
MGSMGGEFAMKTRKFLFICVVAMAAVALLLRMPVTAAAQDDPPGRVARINFLQGNDSFQPSGGGDNDWVTAELNRPVTIGDRVWADSDGLVEMHVGSTAIRMDHNTGISFLNLSDNVVQVQLSAGSIYVHVRELASGDAFEVDTPNLAFSISQAGIYRVDVDPDSNVTVVTVREGQGEVTGGGRSWNIIADQQARFTGTDSLDYSLEDADSLPQSDFDNWSFSRDAREDHVASVQYVSPDTTGCEDLDAYGSWNVVGTYGAVWFPAGVAVGWAPYRFGHWVFIAPWGWTWVDAAPWGFAPLHYGRWAFVSGAWGWVPGPVAVGVRPVYAPALVAWVGGGPGLGVSAPFGVGGGAAWFPLGPRDVFVPAYHVSDVYVTRINTTNTILDRTTILNVYHSPDAGNITYVNQRVGGAVTVVNHVTFVTGRAVAPNTINVSQREIENAPVYHGGPQIQPEHVSIMGNVRVATVHPPDMVVNRTVVAQRTPPPQTIAREENNASNRGEGQGTNRGGGEPSNGPSTPGYRPPNGNGGSGGSAGNNPPANHNEGGNSNTSQGSAPNVRQAPPVRQPTPQEQQVDADRQKQWQDRHEQVHGNQPPANNNSNNNSGNNNGNNGQGNRGGDSHGKPPHR